MNMPGFNAEFALSSVGRGYRQRGNALNDGSRASVLEAAMTNVTCEYDSTLTVEEAGGTSSIDFYKCTTTIDVGGGGGGGPGPVPSGPGGGGGGGGDGGKKPPKPPKNLYSCTKEQLQSPRAQPCFDQQAKDITNNDQNPHYVWCSGADIYCCKRGVSRRGVSEDRCEFVE